MAVLRFLQNPRTAKKIASELAAAIFGQLIFRKRQATGQ
jgi:hypothetical protein